MSSYLTPIYQDNSANYSAVKIKINNPTVLIPENVDPAEYSNFKAVDVEINNPTIEKAEIYKYPYNAGIVTAEHALPTTYAKPDITPLITTYLTNLINNKTLINAEFDLAELPVVNSKLTESIVYIEEEPESVIAESESIKDDEVLNEEAIIPDVVVPKPNLTTLSNEKSKNISFNGKVDDVKIIPEQEIKPEVNVIKVVANLKSSNYDVQAQQMEEIARAAAENDVKALPYIVTEIFSTLIDIIKKDTSKLVGPSNEQIEARKKIIINELVKEQTIAENPNAKDIELPHKITDEDIKLAMELSPLEEAERNKEYALYTMAILAKAYTNEVEKLTGNVLPLTDLPGVSGIVDTLRYNPNPGVKIAAIDALRYIKRDEYKEELVSIFEIVSKDSNPQVAQTAQLALMSI